MGVRLVALRALLRSVQLWDRLRLHALRRLHPGLEIDPAASSNLACARYRLAPGARLRIGPGVVTERQAGQLRFTLERDARVEVAEGAWLRTELAPVTIVAFEGARIAIGPGSLLNGCHVSAKREVRLGRRCFLGPRVAVYDADQHDFDDEHPERAAAVAIGDHTWVATGALVLRGARIGDHSVIGALSLVTSEIPPHTLAHGSPARPQGAVGDRSRAR